MEKVIKMNLNGLTKQLESIKGVTVVSKDKWIEVMASDHVSLAYGGKGLQQVATVYRDAPAFDLYGNLDDDLSRADKNKLYELIINYWKNVDK